MKNQTGDYENTKQELVKFRFMVENARQEVYIIRPNGKIAYVNNIVCKNLGYSFAELLNNSVSLFDPVYGNKFESHFKDLKEKELPPFETIHYSKNGDKLIKRIKSFYLKIGDEEFICGFAEDITARKKAEQALKENREMFKIMTENSSDIIWKLDKNYCFTYISPSGKRIHGYNDEDILGKPIWSLLTPEGIEHVKTVNANRLKKEAEGEKTHAIEYELKQRRKDGQLIWTEVTVIPYRTPDGKIDGYHGVTRNIHKRKVAEIALKESERSNTTLLSNLPGLVYRCKYDELWTMEYLSSGCYELTGYHPEELHNNKVVAYNDILSDKDKETVRAKVKKNIEKNRAFQITYRINTKLGIEKWVLEKGVGIVENQKIIAIEGFITDITERKKVEEELIKAKDKAEESDRLKSAFLANVSHEIRTPMNAILGFSELLKDPELTENIRSEYINLINSSGKRMLETISDILDVSKLEAGLTEIVYSDTNLNEQCDFLLKFFKPEAEHKGLVLKSYCPEKGDKSILVTDKIKLHAIFTNLIKNAIKYTDKGTVEFGYKFKNDEVAFFIKDTGIGIAKEKHKQVFKRFVQADTNEISKYGGAGLGLSISKAYVEMLGGKMFFESKENVGSTFYFILPIIKRPKIEAAKNQTKINDKSSKKIIDHTVLVTDDDGMSVMFLTKFLSKYFKKVVVANSGEKCLEILKSSPDIKLIMMDVKMPGIDGYTTAKELRKFNTNAIVVAQTAFALTGEKEKALEAGCNEYISKPINPQELIGIIRKYF